MNHTITIYSTSSCHYCQIAKDFLRGQNIPFTEYNVGLDAEKRAEMVELTGQMGVPVIVVDGETMVGYSEERLRELLLSDKASQSVTTSDKPVSGESSLWDKVKSTLGLS